MQIENEYGPQGKALGAAGHDYMTWAANLAVGLGTGVPWVMCKEEDAPDPVVSGPGPININNRSTFAWIKLFHLVCNLTLVRGEFFLTVLNKIVKNFSTY